MSFLVLVVGLFVLSFAVLFFVFVGDTLIIVSPFSLMGESPIKTRCVDDRLSFERARHRQKKKNNCNLSTRGFYLSGLLLGGRATMTSIEDWSLLTLSSHIFRQQTQYDLGTRNFCLVAGLVGRRQGYNCNLGTRFRPSWKVTGLQLHCNLRTRGFYLGG